LPPAFCLVVKHAVLHQKQFAAARISLNEVMLSLRLRFLGLQRLQLVVDLLHDVSRK